MSAEDVQETLFFPLLGRAEASHRWPALFHDEWAHTAEEIAAAEGTAATSMGTIPAVVYGLRRTLTVAEIHRYLDRRPGAAVVNIGCGLDRLGPDLGDAGAAATIYNLDFPEVLATRERWIGTAPNEVDLPFSVTDHAWMDRVDASRGLIAVAAGARRSLPLGARAFFATCGASAECTSWWSISCRTLPRHTVEPRTESRIDGCGGRLTRHPRRSRSTAVTSR
ncbi:hypothetical protein [Gordonia sp. VNK21]|uniref:hypothetical protein n=1 Tax=Gordonia sp. VNK21 TaxID=3382483 RepID=UPI0038D411EC